MKAFTKAIVITGTPGTGKSALARELSLLLHKDHLDVGLFIKSEGLAEGYDQKRDSRIVAVERLNKALLSRIKASRRGLIVDSHMAHFLPAKAVSLCIVTMCSLKELQKRLQKRGYKAGKVRENLDAEIFGICLNEAVELGHRVLVLDTTKKSPQNLAKTAKKVLDKKA